MNKRAWFIGFLILGLGCCGWGMVQVKTTGEFVKGAKTTRARVTYLDVRIESPDQKIAGCPGQPRVAWASGLPVMSK